MDYWEKANMVGRLKKSDLDAYTKKQEFIFLYPRNRLLQSTNPLLY